MPPLTRRRLLGAAAMALPALVSGGGAHAASVRSRPAGPRQIAFWGGWTGPDGLAMHGLVRRFNAENRDVQVALTLYNWDLIFDRWRAEFDGGAPPDIVGIHATEVAEFAARGMLRDIAGRVRLQGIDAEEFPTALWRLCGADGGIYAVPIDIHPLGLYINARAAERAGLDPRRPPRDAAELLSWAGRLVDRRRGIWGYAAPAGDVECFRQWFSLLYQYGGRFMDPTGSRCAAGSAAGSRAYGFLRGLVTGGVAMPQEGPVDADFIEGRLLMYAQGPWYIRGAQGAGFPFVTAPLPRIGASGGTWANSHVLGVVNTQDDGQVEAAMRFVAWIHAHALDWAEAGQVPASATARAALPHTSIWPHLRPFAARIDELVYQPALLAHSQLFAETLPTPIITATKAAMLGQQTPSQAARALAQGVDQVLALPASSG